MGIKQRVEDLERKVSTLQSHHEFNRGRVSWDRDRERRELIAIFRSEIKILEGLIDKLLDRLGYERYRVSAQEEHWEIRERNE